MRVTTRRLGVLYAVVGLVMATLGGGIYTHAMFQDSETSEVTIQAASDFTVAAGNFDVDPDHINQPSNGGTFHVDFTIDDRGTVATHRFELRVTETGGTLDAVDATCKPESEQVHCHVGFDRDDIVAQTGEAGTYDLVLSGWWERGRDFELTGAVEITRSEQECTRDGGNTACESDATQSTESEGSCTTSAGNGACASDTSADSTSTDTTTTTTPATTQSAGNDDSCATGSGNSGCESSVDQLVGFQATQQRQAPARD